MMPRAKTRNGKEVGTADSQAAAIFRGGGELGNLIRSFEWSDTVLGPIDNWPESLKTAVRICLGSRYPIVMWWGRSDFIQFYNDAYISVLGSSKHPRWLGRSGRECWAEIWTTIGPMLDGVFDTGEATWSEDLLLVLHRNLPREEGFFTFSYSPLPDDAGGVAGIFCAVTETTGKVVSERRLRTLRDLSTTVMQVKTAEDACLAAAKTLACNRADVPFAMIYLLDREGREARLAAAMGVDPGAAAAPATIIMGGEAATWPLNRVLQTGSPELVTGLEARFGALPGGPWPESPDSALVLPISAQGQATGFLVAGLSPRRVLDDDYRSFFDLVAGHVATAVANARAYESERRRAEALAEIDRAKTTFFSNVSHEFRTPLTLMLGPLENLLAADDAIAPPYRDEVTTAHRNSLRLLKLVNSLLDFSRIEAGRMKGAYAPCDLAAVTADIASTFRSAIESAGLDFTVDCPGLPEPVYIDREMWEKIVLNLLSNAFKFTLEGGITLRLRAEGRQAILTIADTGTGIPDHELPRIFERFHRVEGAKGRTYEGTGIGLALIQELVKLHEGVITVESKLGKGTSFSVALPLGMAHLRPEQIEGAPEPAVSPLAAKGIPKSFADEAVNWLPRNAVTSSLRTPPGPREGPEQKASQKPRILIADDNADMREHVAHILMDEYELESARDGEEALRLLRRNPPDLLLSDIMMPGLDGFGLLQAVRADPALSTLPVIFLSARAGEEMRIEGLEAGADDYLVKPFTANELRARANTHVQMAKARRAAAEREAVLRAEAEAARDEVIDVLESVTDGFIALDENWRITYVNAEAERLNGMRRENMLGRANWEVFPAAVGTTIYHELSQAAWHGKAVDFENYHEPWKRWCHVKAYPRAGGGVSLFYQDITERKHADSASMLLSAIVDSSDDAIISKDLDGVITSWNKSAIRLFGYTAEEAIGQSVAALLIPDDRQQEEPDILARLSKGERVDHFETVRRRKDGSLVDISLTISPVKDEHGRVIGASKIARDISERKRDEQRLVEQAHLLDLTGDAILVRDGRDRIVVWNRGAEEMYGFTREEALGKISHELLRTEFPEPLPGIREILLRDGRWSGELRHSGRAGSRIVTLSRWVAERDEKGDIIRILESNNDITERVRVQEEVRRANQDLEQFAFSASHDLQEPLRGIKILANFSAANSAATSIPMHRNTWDTFVREPHAWRRWSATFSLTRTPGNSKRPPQRLMQTRRWRRPFSLCPAQ